MRLLRSLFTASLPATLVLLFATFWLSGSSASASGPVDLRPTGTLNPDYCPHAMTGTATYALNNATTGTASSVIDLGLVGCFAFSMTSTAGNAEIWFTNSGNTYTATTLYGTFVAGSYSVPKVARYAFFRLPQQQVSVLTPNSLTWTAQKSSVWYYLPTNWPN